MAKSQEARATNRADGTDSQTPGARATERADGTDKQHLSASSVSSVAGVRGEMNRERSQKHEPRTARTARISNIRPRRPCHPWLAFVAKWIKRDLKKHEPRNGRTARVANIYPCHPWLASWPGLRRLVRSGRLKPRFRTHPVRGKGRAHLSDSFADNFDLLSA